MAKRKLTSQPAPQAIRLDTFQQPAGDVGLSLDKLSAAFAEMLGSGEIPYERREGAASDEPEIVITDSADAPAPLDPLVDSDPADTSCEVSPLTILEAMLFVGSPTEEPLTAVGIAGLMRGVRPAEIDTLVGELNARYASQACPYHIVSEGAGYRMAVRPQFAKLRERFRGKARQAKLSQAAVEVLASVAYHQPLTVDEVTKLRGSASGAILNQLVRRNLLHLERDSARPRAAKYSTTPRFLELFGLSTLADLPRTEDLEK